MRKQDGGRKEERERGWDIFPYKHHLSEGDTDGQREGEEGGEKGRKEIMVKRKGERED